MRYTVRVALALSAEQGTALQAPLTIELAAGATVVQHLFFTSPAPALPALQPAPLPTPAPAAPIPAALPATGAADNGQPWLALFALLLMLAGKRVVGRRG